MFPFDFDLNANHDNAHEHCDTTGHAFVKKTFHRPTWCHYCTELLWGLIGQGYVCEICCFVSHERCLQSITQSCCSILESLLERPRSHCWQENSFFKKKFCVVCRRRCEGACDLRCEICECYCHSDCLNFTVADCKMLSYSDEISSPAPLPAHHLREGNLPSSAKCCVCKKSCGQPEMFTGLRCEWCHVTIHTPCSSHLNPECSGGVLKDLILPPTSVVLPRVNLKMEAILNCGAKRQITQSYDSEKSSLISCDVTYCPAPAKEPQSSVSPTNLPAAPPPTSKKRDKSKSKKSKEDKEKHISGANQFSAGTEELITPPDYDYLKETSDVLYSDYQSKGAQAKQFVRINVYDGSTTFAKNAAKQVTVTKDANVEEVLDASLKAFHLCDDLKNYYLIDADEFKLDAPDPPKLEELSSKLDSGQMCSFILRNQIDTRKGSVKVYFQPKGSKCLRFKVIKINSLLTAKDVIDMALQKFGEKVESQVDGKLGEKSPVHYLVISEHIDGELDERALGKSEPVWPIIVASVARSVRHLFLTRFYLRNLSELDRPLRVFIGNLPLHLSSRRYEAILTDLLGPGQRVMDPIYPQYGAVVVQFANVQHGSELVLKLRASTIDEKPLTVLAMPHINANALQPTTIPLLVYVNVKSGGCQGLELLTTFRRLLNPFQVFDLDNAGPIPGLVMFRELQRYKILVCGGDGTVGWVLSCLDDVGQESACVSPPIAILPLGTGNDLARVLRWGSGYTGTDEPLSFLRSVDRAERIPLDRWTVILHGDEKLQQVEADRKALTTLPSADEVLHNVLIMNSYLGIGIDAEVSLGFHLKREEKPQKFNSRLHNKGVYFKLGVKKIGVNREKDLAKYVDLNVDGLSVSLPSIEGIIILNIGRWGSGGDPWGSDRDEKFRKPSQCDGLLEIVGVSGVVHMGQIHSGLRTGYRIAQGANIKIYTKTELAVQIDGEPWSQTPGMIMVTRSALQATMLKKRKINLKPQRRGTSNDTGLSQIEDDIISDNESSCDAAFASGSTIHGLANQAF